MSEFYELRDIKIIDQQIFSRPANLHYIMCHIESSLSLAIGILLYLISIDNYFIIIILSFGIQSYFGVITEDNIWKKLRLGKIEKEKTRELRNKIVNELYIIREDEDFSEVCECFAKNYIEYSKMDFLDVQKKYSLIPNILYLPIMMLNILFILFIFKQSIIATYSGDIFFIIIALIFLYRSILEIFQNISLIPEKINFVKRFSMISVNLRLFQKED